MLSVRLRWKGSCPHHPRYRPQVQGAGAIRGNCPGCTALHSVYHEQVNLERAIRLAERVASGMTLKVSVNGSSKAVNATKERGAVNA